MSRLVSNFPTDRGNKDHHWSMARWVSEAAALFFLCCLPISGCRLVL